jgi:hypothetical protein
MPSAVFTTNVTTATFQTQTGPAAVINPANAVNHASRSMQVFWEVTAITNSGANAVFSVQGRPVAGTGDWFTLQPLVGNASLAWVAVTTATNCDVRRFEGPIPAEIRALITTAGTSPNFTAAAWAVLGD